MDIKIGVGTRTLTGLGAPETCCVELRKLGLEGLRLDVDFSDASALSASEWGAAATAQGLDLTSVYVASALDYAMTSDVGAPESRVMELAVEKAVCLAKNLHIERVVLPSFGASNLGRRNKSSETNGMVETNPNANIFGQVDALRHTARCLRRACALALPHDILVASENTLDVRRIESLFGVTGYTNFRVCLARADSSSLDDVDATEALLVRFTALMPRCLDVVHFRGDVPRLLEQGAVEIQALLEELRAVSFSGWLILDNEYTHPAFRGVSPFMLIRSDLEYIRNHC